LTFFPLSRTRERLKALTEGHCEEGDLRSALVRLAARLMLRKGWRGLRTRWDAPGAAYRNGYRTGRLKTAEGVVEYAAPQMISDRAVPFRSRLREIIRGRTGELEALAVGGHKVLLHFRGAKRTQQAAASSSRPCAGAASPIRCWLPPMARLV
jgi:hypothetical protein